MLARFTKISNDRHRLEIVRDDGSTESAELETKSLLMHDLIHFAVESEAGLEKSFWGSVYSGKSFKDLMGDVPMNSTAPETELAMTEMIVGVTTGFLLGKGDATQAMAVLENGIRAYGLAVPSYLNPVFFAGVQSRMRKLEGHWKATKFGETMELSWPAN